MVQGNHYIDKLLEQNTHRPVLSCHWIRDVNRKFFVGKRLLIPVPFNLVGEEALPLHRESMLDYGREWVTNKEKKNWRR